MPTALALLLLLASGPEPPLPARARTDHVVVRTDLSKAWAESVATAIEAERKAWLETLRDVLPRRPEPRPLTVLAFASSAAYRRHAATASPAHALELGWYDPATATATVHTDTAFPARHEAAHWILREVLALPDREDMPVWVVEGVPCLAESGPRDGPSRYRLFRLKALVRGGVDPAAGLDVPASDLGRGQDDALYAVGFAVAHWLQTRRPAWMRAYLTSIRARGPLPSLPAIAGKDLEALEKEVRAHVATLPDVPRAGASRLFPALIPDADRPWSEAEAGRQIEFLRHPDLDVVRTAMRWLREHDEPAVADALLATMPDEGDRFRMDACRLLMDDRPEAVLPWLIDLLEAEEVEIRRRAIETLNLLTRQRLGFKPLDGPEARRTSVVRWRAWLADRRKEKR